MNPQSLSKLSRVPSVKEEALSIITPVNKPSQSKVFSSADMWNIQRKRRVISRRWVA